MNGIELVRKYFPGATEDEADYMLWEQTGFPMVGGKKVEQELKQKAERMRRLLGEGSE